MKRKVQFQFRAVLFLSGFLAIQFMTVPGHGTQTVPDAAWGAAGAAKQTDKVQLPAGAGSDWWSTVQRNLRDSEYNVSRGEKTALSGSKAAWQAPNRAHNLRTWFDDKGIRVVPRNSSDTPAWNWGVALSGYGDPENLTSAVRAKPKVNGNRIEYQRGQVTEWYMNDGRGLEQGFTLHGPPSAIKAGKILLRMEIEGDLRGALNASSGAVEFFTAGGVRVLEFGKLHAVDSNGQELPAQFGVSDTRLDIVVEAEGAAYPIYVDPLLTGPSWTAESDQADTNFGLSVATAGDVNGDGYSDVIVGAPYFDNGQAYEGGAFVYLGGPSGLANTPTWTAESDQAYAWFGYSVATAGDVNNDGYSDVIVGAPKFDNKQDDDGCVFVYLGGASGLSPTPAWTAKSDLAYVDFGSSVATAGDVNGDGYSDVVVGAHYFSNGQAFEGRSFVYLGGASGLSQIPAWTAESDQDYARFGFSVATAGDVNGDGYSDVIIGAPGYNNGQTQEGRSYVYLGGPSGLSLIPAWTTESDQAVANYGYSVATAGDVNGDGFSDVIVGAFYFNNGQSDEGRAFVYLGGVSGLSTTPAWTAESDLAQAFFGASVATAGDVNGDDYSDVIVGIPGFTNGQAQEGGAFVYLGGPSGLSITPAWTAESDLDNAKFGHSVATAGDVNGDGYSDVIVGAPYFANGQNNEGRAFVYLGGSYLSTLSLSFTGIGGGLVTSTPPGISCNVNCSAQFPYNTLVMLHAAPDEYSLSPVWGSPCVVNQSGDCVANMDGDKSVVATFNRDKAHMTRIGDTDTYYSTLQEAYDNAPADSLIKAWGVEFGENLNANQNKTVTIEGGYNGAYTENSGYTLLKGILTIKYGSLILENLAIK